MIRHAALEHASPIRHRIVLDDAHETVGVGERQRLQQNRIDHATDGRGCADAKRERQDRDDGEARRQTEGSRRVSHVLPQLIEPDRNPHGAGILADQRYVTERSEGGATRLIGRHPSRDVVLGFPLDVIVNVRIQVG